MSAGSLPRWIDFGLIPLLNLTAAFLVSGLVVLLIGENPLDAVQVLIWGSIGYGEGIGFTLFYATNFIFTGLAVAVAFHAGLFNIGGEGQAYLGGLGAALACLALDQYTPWWITVPVAVLAAALYGAAWAAIPAWLQAKRGSHIVITTIMFNFIGTALMGYLLVKVINKSGSMQPETRTFAEGGQLPLLGEFFGTSFFGSSQVNLAVFLAVAALVLVWLLIWRTRLGYEIRTFGANPAAAVYAGISPVRITIITMLISGGLAGLMAINELVGSQHRLLIEYVAGYGFVGIAVALMGRAHPVGIMLSAILFGMLYQGGAELAFEMPAITRDMIVVIQGLVILFAGALEYMFRPALVRLFSFSAKPAAAAGKTA